MIDFLSVVITFEVSKEQRKIAPPIHPTIKDLSSSGLKAEQEIPTSEETSSLVLLPLLIDLLRVEDDDAETGVKFFGRSWMKTAKIWTRIKLYVVCRTMSPDVVVCCDEDWSFHRRILPSNPRLMRRFPFSRLSAAVKGQELDVRGNKRIKNHSSEGKHLWHHETNFPVFLKIFFSKRLTAKRHTLFNKIISLKVTSGTSIGNQMGKLNHKNYINTWCPI